MIKREVFPKTTEELVKIIREYATGAESVAMQAGHFLVYYDHTENLVLPCVRQELVGPRFSHIGEIAGEFPMLTWELGLRLLGEIQSPRKSVLVIANDWQYLPPKIDRMQFYKKYPDLFEVYKQKLDENEDISLMTQYDLGKKSKTGVWFSEVSLRNQFNRVITKKIRKGDLSQDKYIIEKNNNELTCSLVDVIGRQHQIYCGGKRGNCTHELAELNRQVLDEAKFDLLINFYPLVCKHFIQTGTDWAYEMFLTHQITINIGMQSTDVFSESDLMNECEVTVHGN